MSIAPGDLLGNLLEQRFCSVAPVTSLAAIVAGAPELRRMSQPIYASLVHNRGRIASALEPARVSALSRRLALTVRLHLAERYQYVALNDHDDALLQDRYGEFLLRFRNGLVTSAPARLSSAINRELAHHHACLRDWVRAKLQQVDALNWFEAGGQDSICAEYTPATQLEVLGIEPSRLMSPILDLGCGPEARLVHHLAGLGFEDVVGVDRDGDGGLAARGDWFSIPWRPGSWGTILAHHSFSLHFTHAHLRSSAAAGNFAQAYMRILAALRPGGTFAYAPALPFIEAHLAKDRFVVRSRPVDAARLSAKVALASTQVKRIG